MLRLIVCVVFLSLLVGCYPEPKVEPVKPTPEYIERMRNATHPDGSPVGERGMGRRGKKTESEPYVDWQAAASVVVTACKTKKRNTRLH